MSVWQRGIYTRNKPGRIYKKLAFSINGELRFDRVNNFVDNYKIDNNNSTPFVYGASMIYPHSKSFSLILSVNNSSFRTYTGTDRRSEIKSTYVG